MKKRPLFAALLCIAVLLSGCGSAAGNTAPSPGSDTGKGSTSQPLSELEQIALQTEAWEAAGTYHDEAAYRETLLRTAELARKSDQGTYCCKDPKELTEDKLAALTDAALRCNYAYSIFLDFDPFSQKDLHATIGMLIIYTPGTLETESIWNMNGDYPALPEGNYYTVKKADLLPFLASTLAPAAQAYLEYGESSMEEWNWHETEDGYIYVDVTGLTATLASGMPQFTGIEPLGGDRYLVRCEMLGMTTYPMAMVVEDNALPGQPPHMVVLDCVSAGAWNGIEFLEQEEVDALRKQYWVTGEGGQEAVDLLTRLETLSPVPYHTELAGQMSSAMEQALSDAKISSEMVGTITFEAYVQALNMAPAMHRFSEDDEWIPADPEHTASYGDEWNIYPAEELENAFQKRYGIDLTANDRAWLNNQIFVPRGYYTDGPMAVYDGENYYIYTRGIGYMDFPYKSSLTYNYDGTYTAVFTVLPLSWDDPGGTSVLHMRNVGTEEEPFFQLIGYELPM